jgi:hypothetical protein
MATTGLTNLYEITIFQWRRINWMQPYLAIDETRIEQFTKELLCLLSCMKSLNKFNSALDLPDYVEKITDFS